MKYQYKFIISSIIITTLAACGKVDVEAEVKNMINAECKLEEYSNEKELSATKAAAALAEFKKITDDIKTKLKTQDEKDEFIIFYGAVTKQSEKCTNPIFNRENLDAAKFYLNSQR